MRNLLRELRASHNLTQADLAERAGVSRQTIISIESGRYNPTIGLAYKLARLFDTTIEDLFLLAEEISVEDDHE
jgi:putative transcriptional regulator